jgi:hypothetical protein
MDVHSIKGMYRGSKGYTGEVEGMLKGSKRDVKEM